MQKTRLSIFGATGSVGRTALDLVAQHPDKFEFIALTANKNAEGLAELARKFLPKFVALADESFGPELAERLYGTSIRCIAGNSALKQVASMESDIVLVAIVGYAGLEPTMIALDHCNIMALANKEALVCAGHLIKSKAKDNNVTIIPVDSEHSAIFQIWKEGRSVEKITLTASGGPFRKWSAEQIASASPRQALAHPNWSMGPKISVDSASMMNKGLELIEAVHLFEFMPKQVDIVVHPQSIVHSLVSFHDGSVLAQLGMPDMKTPISYALGWPERLKNNVERLDLVRLARLDFHAPDEQRFPALRLARQAAQDLNRAPIILNAANEIAVDAFLAGQIAFGRITEIAAHMLEAFSNWVPPDALDEIVELDRRVRAFALQNLA